jgi:hypothetical protein
MALHMKSLRHLISNSSDVEEFPEDVIFQSQAHKIIMICLEPEINNGNKPLIKETLWCLSNLCLAQPRRLDTLLEHGILIKVKQYLNVDELVNFESIYWLLSNLISDYHEPRVDIVSHGYLNFLFENVEAVKESPKLSSIVSWFAMNFMEDITGIDPKDIRQLLIIMNHLTQDQMADDVKENVIFSLYSYLLSENHDIFLLKELNLLHFLKTIFISNNYKFQTAIIKIFTKLSSHNSEIVNCFLNKNFKECLLLKIKYSCSMIQGELMTILSNLISVGIEQAQILSDLKTIETVRDFILCNEKSPYAKHFAIDVLASLFSMFDSTGKEHLIYKAGYLDCMFALFEIKDPKSCKKVLGYFEEVLKWGCDRFQRM